MRRRLAAGRRRGRLGSQEEISILPLADRVREMTGSDCEIHQIPYEEAYEQGFEDMPRRYPDIAKIGREIDWAPTASLDAIFGDVIAHQTEGVDV